MTTTRKKLQIGIAAITASLTLLVAFNFSAGAEKKAVSKKQRGVTSVVELQQLLLQPERTGTECTVRGIYSGSQHGQVLIESPVAEKEEQATVACKLSAGQADVLKDVPPGSELVLTGNAVSGNGTVVLDNCRLITVNIQ